jgi:hypothetical protein
LRYQNASDIRTDLQRLKRDTESGRSASVISGTMQEAPAVPKKKLWRIVFPAAVLFLAALVAGVLSPASRQIADRQGHHCPGRFRQQHGRPSLRRHTPAGAHRRVEAVAIPECGWGKQSCGDLEADGSPSQ